MLLKKSPHNMISFGVSLYQKEKFSFINQLQMEILSMLEKMRLDRYQKELMLKLYLGEHLMLLVNEKY